MIPSIPWLHLTFSLLGSLMLHEPTILNHYITHSIQGRSFTEATTRPIKIQKRGRESGTYDDRKTEGWNRQREQGARGRAGSLVCSASILWSTNDEYTQSLPSAWLSSVSHPCSESISKAPTSHPSQQGKGTPLLTHPFSGSTCSFASHLSIPPPEPTDHTQQSWSCLHPEQSPEGYGRWHMKLGGFCLFFPSVNFRPAKVWAGVIKQADRLTRWHNWLQPQGLPVSRRQKEESPQMAKSPDLPLVKKCSAWTLAWATVTILSVLGTLVHVPGFSADQEVHTGVTLVARPWPWPKDIMTQLCKKSGFGCYIILIGQNSFHVPNYIVTSQKEEKFTCSGKE